MMIKFFKKEKSSKKDSLTLNPNSYWQFAVCSLFLVALFSFLFGYNLFRQVNREPALPDVNTKDLNQIVTKERMDKVLDYFSTRREKSIRILNSPSPVVDPSL